jgi:hypothetical protein
MTGAGMLICLSAPLINLISPVAAWIKFQEVLDLQYGISHQRRSRNGTPCQAHLSFELKLMKVKLQRFVVFFLSVIYISVPVGAQKKITREPSVKAADAEARNLRKQQLLLLHENLLSRTLDSIKKMDEVALRLSVRNQLLHLSLGE